MEFELLSHINISSVLVKAVCSLAENEEEKILKASEKAACGSVNALKNKSDIFRLAVMLKSAEETHKKYIEKGIPDKIFYDTFDDIRIWCEENDNKGLKNYNWILNHINFEIFKLGRLQFQFYRATNPMLHYNKLPFERGDSLLYIHIPRGKNLDIGECISSVNEAKSFFKKYFSEFNYKGFFCESWLLYDGNKYFMNSASNILKFQTLFDIAYSINFENQTYDRIFGCKALPFLKKQINALPENTSLQKSAKEYKLRGGKYGIGIATLKKEYL